MTRKEKIKNLTEYIHQQTDEWWDIDSPTKVSEAIEKLISDEVVAALEKVKEHQWYDISPQGKTARSVALPFINAAIAAEKSRV